MRALAATLLLTVATAGCYAPSPPSGSYLCGADSACPDGLTCECGQCVKEVGEAACAFAISAPTGNRVDVEEHERFSIVVSALDRNGAPATRFAGEVKLSSTWGDVCVGEGGCAALPDRVRLTGGTATATVQLNRETIPPQTAILRAEFAGNVGTSGKMRLNVVSPRFLRDPAPLVAPLTIVPPTSYGFATVFMGAPSVVKVSDGWRMFYTGALVKKLSGKDEVSLGVGVASANDGKSFVPTAEPLFEARTDDPDKLAGAASAIVTADDARLFIGRKQAFDTPLATGFAFATITRLRAPSASGPFAPDPMPVITIKTAADNSCSFCEAIDVPGVLRDPDPALSGGGPNAEIMYFSSFQNTVDDAGMQSTAVSVVRAASVDGEAFVVDPSPVLRSTRDEIVLYSPRVIVDGTVYKMFYSVVGFDLSRPLSNLVDPCSAEYRVGYATSTDGYYWVRSPRNTPPPRAMQTEETAPAFDTDRTDGSWEGGNATAGASILVSSVVPADGVDPANGIALYYSPFNRIVLSCLPNGVGRAVRR